MTDMPYMEAPHSKEYIESLLTGLRKFANGKIVLTGVCFKAGEIGAACMEGENVEYIFTPHVDAAYHGTGDIFTSTLTCGVLMGKTLPESALIAAKFTAGCIKITKEQYPEMKYGVNFESQIPNLLKLLEII